MADELDQSEVQYDMPPDGFKRSASDMEENNDSTGDTGPSKRARLEYETIHLDGRFLIQSRNAGAIIGKGGSNINRLRNDFKASVSVPDCPGPERILTLGGSINVIGQMLLDIIPRLDDYSHNKGLDFRCEVRMLVHQSHAGSLIGRAGFKIKELRERTGASIKIFSDCLPRSSERVVQISGTPEIVVNCVQDICESISQTPVKQPINLYDPHNFDEYYAKEYGGYGGMDDGPRGFKGGRGGRGSRGGSGGRSRGGRGGDGGGWNSRMDYGRGGSDGPRGMGGSDGYGGGGSRGWSDYDDDMPPMNRMMSRGGGPGGRSGGMRSQGNFSNGGGMGRGGLGGNRDSGRMGGSRGGRGGRNDGSIYDRQGSGSGGGMGRMGGSGMGGGRRMQDDIMDVGGDSNMRPQIHGNMQQNFDSYRSQGGSGGGGSAQGSGPKDGSEYIESQGQSWNYNG